MKRSSVQERESLRETVVVGEVNAVNLALKFLAGGPPRNQLSQSMERALNG